MPYEIRDMLKRMERNVNEGNIPTAAQHSLAISAKRLADAAEHQAISLKRLADHFCPAIGGADESSNQH